MRTISISDLIGKSVNKTGEILFRPFSSKKWLKLLLIAFLAGAMSGGNFNSSNNNRQQERRDTGVQTQTSAVQAAGSGERAGVAQPAAIRPAENPAQARNRIKIIVIVSAAIILFIVLMLILSAWLGARFRFIWFNSIACNRSDISEPYVRHAREANSYFKFSIVFTAAFLVFMILLIGCTVFYMNSNHAFDKGFTWNAAVGFKLLFTPVMLFITVLFAVLVFSFLVEQFVVPIMALDNLTIMPALKMFDSIFKANWKDILLFILVFIALNFVAGVCVLLLAIILIIVILLLAALLFGLPYFLIAVLLKAKMIFTIYAVVAGIPFIIIALLSFMAAGLPIAVFFRQFSINFLLSLNCGYTQESLDSYAAKRIEGVKTRMPVVLITFLLGVFMVFIMAILAAIAIPNFIRARDTALANQRAAAASQSSVWPGVKI